MSAEEQLENYLEESLELLQDDGFEVIAADGSTFRAVALKAKGTVELVFVFKKFTRLSAKRMKKFTSDAYAYAQQTRKSTALPMSTKDPLWIFAVALAAEAADEAVEEVTDQVAESLTIEDCAHPVIYDANEDDVYFCKQTGRSGEFKKVAKYVEKYLVID